MVKQKVFRYAQSKSGLCFVLWVWGQAPGNNNEGQPERDNKICEYDCLLLVVDE